MSAETLTVSRLIPEEDLIDGLFYKCDKEKTGNVQVSSLIKYLKSTAGQDTESVTAIENLSIMLDPKGTDKVIDLITYRTGISQWIKEVRQNNNDSGSLDNSIHQDFLKKQQIDVDYPENLFSFHNHRPAKCEDMDMSSTTTESSVLDVSTRHFESEISELSTRVGDLQHQNRRLAEENSKLEQQLEQQEETLTALNTDKTQLNRRIRSLQELVDLRVETQEENSELKLSLSKYHETRRELENRLNQLERENSSLRGQIEDFESKVQILSSELENANIQQKSLQSTLIEQKHLLRKLTEEKTMHEVQISERTSQLENLQTYVAEVNKMNEELKHEQEDLQIQLIQAQQEISNLHLKDDKPNMSSSSGCVDDMDDVGDVGTEEGGGDTQSTAACSTPVKKNSIHTEIKDVLGESLHLPSPLSDKELDESFHQRCNSVGVESWSTDDLATLQIEALAPGEEDVEGQGEMVKPGRTLDASTVVEKLQQQQQEFKNQVNAVLREVRDEKEEKSNLSRRLFSSADYEEYTTAPEENREEEEEQPSRETDVQTKFKKLLLLLQKLKGENARLVRVHDEAVESLSNWELNLDCGVDNRLTVLRDVLLEERAHKKQYQHQVERLKEKLKETSQQLKDKGETTHMLRQELRELEEQVSQLKTANLDLAEKCHKSEIRVSEIQEDILQSSFNLEREKLRNNELEDSLASTKLARQLDLRDIWRLVQKDVETECMEEQYDSPLSSSTDLLKEQISKEIECLRESLVKRQFALGALKGKPMKLKLDASGNYSQNMDLSPSSPLVDALTIDFFNGNYQMSRPGTKHSRALKSMSGYSSLDRDSCSACQNNISAPSHHTLSCPSLPHRHHPGEPLTDHPGIYPYTNLNTSSSSSTSGIDVSPRSSRSVDGQNRRRDFIRSSIKYGSGSQTSAESNANSDSSHPRQHRYSRSIGERLNKKERTRGQSPSGFRRQSFTNAIENRKDANDNNVSHFSRSRSSSFQAAIERGRRSPTDELDFTSTSQDSTQEVTDHPAQSVQQELYAASRNDGKTVSFHLSTEEFYDAPDEIVSPDSESQFQDRADNQQTQHSPRVSGVPAVPAGRKLSTLVEEDPDTDPPPTSQPVSPLPVTPQLIRSIVDQYATPTKQRSQKSNKTESTALAFSKDQVKKKSKEVTSSKTPGEAQDKKETTSKRKTQAHTEEQPAQIKEGSMETPPTLTEASQSTKPSANTRKMPVKMEESLVLPGSPEFGMETVRLSPSSSPRLKPQSRLAKLRQNNLAKKRDQLRTMKLPDLRELTEGDTPAPPELLQVSENTLTPPPPSDDMVTPSLPDEFLQKLGLQPVEDEELLSTEDLPENEIERKFCSLALAFKTDKLTLKRRRKVQERSRDLAEDNVDRELTGIREATEELSQAVADAKLRDVIERIQGHMEVLLQSTSKVSSQAEVFGAVQQEERMSFAMEVMIKYVNNLKALYDKDHSDLEDARKLLQDKPFGAQPFLDLGGNRAMSLANLNLKLPHQRSRSPSPAAAAKDKTRRRSEVALPRMCGGSGSPMLRHSASLDIPFFTDFKQPGWSREPLAEDEDPKQRFQALVGNTQMRNAVATTFRRGSLERQPNVQSSKAPSLPLSRENSTDKKKESEEVKAPVKQGSHEEEAYQKGFEDGMKAKLSQELSELRENQNHIGQSLEDVMDRVEKSKEEDEREKEEAAERRLMQLRALGLQKPSWENAGHTFRLALAGLIFMMAVGMVIMTIIPGSASGMELHANIQHFGAPPM